MGTAMSRTPNTIDPWGMAKTSLLVSVSIESVCRKCPLCLSTVDNYSSKGSSTEITLAKISQTCLFLQLHVRTLISFDQC